MLTHHTASMNPLEHQIHYPLGDALPAEGATLEVAPGVRWVRMGLPFLPVRGYLGSVDEGEVLGEMDPSMIIF